MSSDIHIEPRRDEVVVRFRREGALEDVSRHSLLVGRLTARAFKKLGRLDPDLELAHQYTVIQLSTTTGRVEVLLSTHPTVHGERMVLRLQTPQSVDKLDLHAELLELLSRPYGLVLLSAPEGNGLSATAYASLGHIVEHSQGRSSIFSLEDPVRSFLDGVIQVQVESGRPELNHACHVRDATRQDADLLHCDAVPDEECASELLRAASTGHLVLAQVIAADVAGALKSFADLIHDATSLRQLGRILQGVMSQRLAPRLCPDCREPAELPARARATVEAELGRIPDFWRPRGCSSCKGSGSRGWTAIQQVLASDEQVGELLVERLPLVLFRQQLQRLGHPAMRRCALEAAAAGRISLDEALSISS